jgi:hypothetical protein
MTTSLRRRPSVTEASLADGASAIAHGRRRPMRVARQAAARGDAGAGRASEQQFHAHLNDVTRTNRTDAIAVQKLFQVTDA